MAALYISPYGSGLQDGSSPENAGTLSMLSAFIAAAGPGGEVRLLADQGVYQQSVEIDVTAGGVAGSPVTIRGVDSNGDTMAAEITGTRAENWTPGQNNGLQLFRLLDGADNLTFQDMSVKNFGDGVFRIGADLENLTIKQIDAANVHRFVEDQAFVPGTTATVSGLTVQDVDVEGFTRNTIRLKYDSHDVVIQDVKGDSQSQDGGLYIVGVHLEGTVHDVLLLRVEMDNCNGNGDPDEYWNGDGFATERDAYDIRIEDCSAANNSDAGFDIKSSTTVLVNAVADGNKRNFRFWSDTITVEDSISLDPAKLGGISAPEHVWLRDGAVVKLDNFQASDSGLPVTLFDLSEGNATLRLINMTVPDIYVDRIRLSKNSTIEMLAPDNPPPAASPTDNDAPIGIAVAGGTVVENATAGTLVATLTALDPDAGDSHTFAITSGGAPFEIVGNQLVVKAGVPLDYEDQNARVLNVKVTDQGGLSQTQTIVVYLTNVGETGTSGNDVILGGAGGDTMTGKAGNDTYLVNSALDVVVEKSNEGTDTVNATIAAYTLAESVEVLNYVGTGSFTGIGNGSNNVITGGAANDTLNGGNGNDTLYGLGGADNLLGGAGNDKAYGGDDADNISGDIGNDTLRGDAGDDTISGGDGTDNLDGGTGADTLNGDGGNDTVNGGDDADNVSGGSGNDSVGGDAGDDQLFGGSGNDTLNGGAGADVLKGESGDDKAYGGDDADSVSGGIGNDTLGGDAGDDQLFGEDGNDTLNGGTGNDKLYGGIGNDKLYGGEDADSIFGSAGNDTLGGDDGNDTLAGEDGNDSLNGGLGNDTLKGDAGNDTAYGGDGADNVSGGTGNDTLGGDAGDDLLFGDDGVDSLSGGVGNDALSGGAGNDKLYGGDDSDNLSGGSSNDTLYGEAGNDFLFGDDGTDTLYGGAGGDLLNGGAGNDKMLGDIGDDVYVVNASKDVVTEYLDEGNDRVESSITYTLGANLENLTLTGSGAINGTGNTLDNILVGNIGANTLTGGAGNDILDGGGGNDKLAGGEGADTYLFGRGGGQDTITNNDADHSPDRLVFGATIGEHDLWFSNSGGDLVISVIGSGDKATLKGWFSDSNNQLDEIQLADGAVLETTGVQQMVNAMAFSAAPSSLSDLTAAQHASVEAAIAANWQA